MESPPGRRDGGGCGHAPTVARESQGRLKRCSGVSPGRARTCPSAPTVIACTDPPTPLTPWLPRPPRIRGSCCPPGPTCAPGSSSVLQDAGVDWAWQGAAGAARRWEQQTGPADLDVWWRPGTGAAPVEVERPGRPAVRRAARRAGGRRPRSCPPVPHEPRGARRHRPGGHRPDPRGPAGRAGPAAARRRWSIASAGPEPAPDRGGGGRGPARPAAAAWPGPGARAPRRRPGRVDAPRRQAGRTAASRQWSDSLGAPLAGRGGGGPGG